METQGCRGRWADRVFHLCSLLSPTPSFPMERPFPIGRPLHGANLQQLAPAFRPQGIFGQGRKPRTGSLTYVSSTILLGLFWSGKTGKEGGRGSGTVQAANELSDLDTVKGELYYAALGVELGREVA